MAYIDIYNNEEQNCLICSDSLIFAGTPADLNCYVCKKPVKAMEYCRQNHFVCEVCRLGSSYELVKAFCMNSRTTDPTALAVDIMNSPLIRTHGAEHHFIVPAVLLTAVHNKTANPVNLKEALDLAEIQAKEVPITCTFEKGTCGAAIGSGIFLSIFTERDEMMDEEFSLANNLTAESLQSVTTSHGPKCCKRDTYLSIDETVNFLRDKFAIELEQSVAKCTFSLRNRTCGHEDCNFYNIGFSIA